MKEQIIFRHAQSGKELCTITSGWANHVAHQVPQINCEITLVGQSFWVTKLSYLVNKNLWSCVVFVE
jgi:hypothetical protein